MTRTLAIINQKGGVGKTTTVANLGAAFAAAGQRVLLLDLDPQSHLTLSLDVEPGSAAVDVYRVLTEGQAIDGAARPVRENTWLVPSYISLAAAEMELVGVVGREVILRDALSAITQPYDFILIDCPPSLGLLTVNALTAAREIVVPLQPHFLALQGVGKLFETVTLVRDRLNPALSVTGVLLCLYEAGTRLAAEVVEDLTRFLDAGRGTGAPWADARIFQTVIRRNIKLAECPSHGRTIFDYEPRSNGALDYGRLARELLGQLETPNLSVHTPAPVVDAAPETARESVTHADSPAEGLVDGGVEDRLNEPADARMRPGTPGDSGVTANVG